MTRSAETAGSTDGIVRKNHPYDKGYWTAYYGLPRPDDDEGKEGWDDFIRERAYEAACIEGLSHDDAVDATNTALASKAGGVAS